MKWNVITTLEELDRELALGRACMSRYAAKNEVEVLMWKLQEHLAFDPDNILKGTLAQENTPKEISDFYKEKMWKRFGPAYAADNQQLREWLTTTPLENIAAYTAYYVRNFEADKVTGCYDAAQDFYADSWYMWSDYEAKRITGCAFVNCVYQQVDELNKHIEEGKAKGLTMDEIILHDAMWGLLPSAYDEVLTELARDILQHALSQLPDKPYIWSDLGKKSYAPEMLRYAAEKLQEKGIDIGYKSDYTIEQGYLLNFFSRLYWREAASRPEDDDDDLNEEDDEE